MVKTIMKHIITFEDNTIFEGDALEGTWNKSPDKKIKKWEYHLNDKKAIVFENFEQYNHIIKFGKGFNSSMKGIISIYLLGKYKDKIRRVHLDILKNKIQCDVIEWGMDYNNKSHSGWKLGIENDAPKLYTI